MFFFHYISDHSIEYLFLNSQIIILQKHIVKIADAELNL